MTRRSAVKITFSVLVVLVATSAVAQGGGKQDSPVLRTPFFADMADGADPDIFYTSEGIIVTTNVYEGLARYAPNSTRILPALATRWSVSKDGRTYTFRLRSGVRFHDGSQLDSASVKFSFDRRQKVNGPGAYMLADVRRIATPDARTVVLTLKGPNSAFLDYLAAPYGPKILSPKTVKAEEKSGDLAKAYLRSHDAGTGPYTIDRFQAGTLISLNRYDGYWGGKPLYARVEIPIIPDVTTQRLRFQASQLNLLPKGFTPGDIERFKAQKGTTVTQHRALAKNFLFVNANKGVFADDAIRQALRDAIDKSRLTRAVFGTYARPSRQLYPAGTVPLSAHREPHSYNLTKLRNAVSAVTNKRVQLAYDATEQATNGRLADLIAVDLNKAGLQVTTRGVQFAEVFAWPGNPSRAPDLFLMTAVPDAVHPDTWIRIFMNGQSPINFLSCKETPAADKAMDRGITATTRAKVTASYGLAGNLVARGGCFISIADVDDVFVSKGVQGFARAHLLAAQRSTLVAPLRPSR